MPWDLSSSRWKDGTLECLKRKILDWHILTESEILPSYLLLLDKMFEKSLLVENRRSLNSQICLPLPPEC